jgi:hypothetical protein
MFPVNTKTDIRYGSVIYPKKNRYFCGSFSRRAQPSDLSYLVCGKLCKPMALTPNHRLRMRMRSMARAACHLFFLNSVRNIILNSAEIKMVRIHAQFIVAIGAVVTHKKITRLHAGREKIRKAVRLVGYVLNLKTAVTSLKRTRPQPASSVWVLDNLRPESSDVPGGRLRDGDCDNTISVSHDAFSFTESGLVRLKRVLSHSFEPFVFYHKTSHFVP